MKLILILAFFFTVDACAKGSPRPSIPLPTPSPVETPEVSPEKKPYLVIRRCTNCTAKEWKFIQEALVKTNETVETTCFASFMLKRKLIQTLSRSNQQVLDSLVGANVPVDVEMYYTTDRVLGYTYPNQPVGQYKEWINRRYMTEWGRCDLASLLGHETSHKIGYDHDYQATSRRNSSVPYSINAAFDSCCVRE